jgi:hypothetical protein
MPARLTAKFGFDRLRLAVLNDFLSAAKSIIV